MGRRITIGQPNGPKINLNVPDGVDTQYRQEVQSSNRLTPSQVLSKVQVTLYNMLPRPFAEFTEDIRVRIARSIALGVSQGLRAANANPPKNRRGSGGGAGGHIVERPDPSKYDI